MSQFVCHQTLHSCIALKFNKVGCRDNMVKYIMIFKTTIQWLIIWNTIDISSLTVSGKLMGVNHEDLGRNLRRYNDTELYISWYPVQYHWKEMYFQLLGDMSIHQLGQTEAANMIKSWHGSICQNYRPFWGREQLVTRRFSSPSTSNVELWCFLLLSSATWRRKRSVRLRVIWDAMPVMWNHCNRFLRPMIRQKMGFIHTIDSRYIAVPYRTTPHTVHYFWR